MLPSVRLVFVSIALLFLLPVPGATAGPRRSILRSLGDGSDAPDAAVDLNSTTFDTVLKDSPAAFAVVEFFAHWSPACRNYKPHYEKVARLFNGPDAVHPGIIIMARVDCAVKMNTDLCDRFSVAHYPMLLWGSPHKFASGRWNPKQDKAEIQAIDDGRTAERLLNWINKQIGSSFGLDDEKYENENTLPQNASDPEQSGEQQTEGPLDPNPCSVLIAELPGDGNEELEEETIEELSQNAQINEKDDCERRGPLCWRWAVKCWFGM